MKKIVFSFLLILSVLSSCKKDNSTSGSGTFKITYNGKTYNTTYVNIPIPTQNGTFSLQYSKPSGTSGLYKYMFFVLIDNNTQAYLDVWTPALIKDGTTYTSNSSQNITVDFQLVVNNTDAPIAKSTVTFTSSIYPGHNAGTVKSYNSSNAIICTADFDFVAK